MNKKNVIIDVDTGCDDAVEIVLATLNPQLDIKGITCVAGNTEVHHVIQNTANILAYIDSNIPVFKGAVKPLYHELENDGFHGENGLGSVQLKKVDVIDREDAISFIYHTAKECKHISLLCSGPQTNVATLLMKHPDVKEYIDEIVFMGGSICGGNIKVMSEFNVFADPEACQIVMESNIPLKMVGLDVTMIPYVDDSIRETIKKIDLKEAKLCDQVFSYLKTMEIYEPDHKSHIHDVIALFALVHPEAFTFEDYYVEIETKGELTRGMSVVDIHRVMNKQSNCKVAVDLDADAFWSWFLTCLGGKK